jgi:hypothetical protein
VLLKSGKNNNLPLPASHSPNDGAPTWSQRVSEYFNPMVMDAFSLRPQLVLCSPEAFSELNENLRRPTTALVHLRRSPNADVESACIKETHENFILGSAVKVEPECHDTKYKLKRQRPPLYLPPTSLFTTDHPALVDTQVYKQADTAQRCLAGLPM